MKNIIKSFALMVASASLAACAMQPAEGESVETVEQDLTLASLQTTSLSLSSSTKLASSTLLRAVQPTAEGSKERGVVSSKAADLKLAAMAHRIIECRGGVSTRDFESQGESIMPTFLQLNLKNGMVLFPNGAIAQFPNGEKVLRIRGDIALGASLACPAAEGGEAALDAVRNVVNLTAVQKLAPEVGAYWAQAWSRAGKPGDCPKWTYLGVASGDPRNLENLRKGFVKTTEYFLVDGDPEAALACASGYGGSFVVDVKDKVIETDPAYWEDPRDFGGAGSPYYNAQVYGYFHNMALYMDFYAHINRESENCEDPHKFGALQPMNCSDDAAYPWYCTSSCEP